MTHPARIGGKMKRLKEFVQSMGEVAATLDVNLETVNIERGEATIMVESEDIGNGEDNVEATVSCDGEYKGVAVFRVECLSEVHRVTTPKAAFGVLYI